MERKQRALDRAVAAADKLVRQQKPADEIRSQLPGIQSRYGLTSLALVVEGGGEDGEHVHITGTINPSKSSASRTLANIAKIKAEIAELDKYIKDKLKHPTLRPGPCAEEALDTASYAVSSSQRRSTQPLGRTHGCHTCCSQRAQRARFRADHQPPSTLIRLGLRKGPQQLYPQCRNCSNEQGGVLSDITKKHKEKVKLEKRLGRLQKKLGTAA